MYQFATLYSHGRDVDLEQCDQRPSCVPRSLNIIHTCTVGKELTANVEEGNQYDLHMVTILKDRKIVSYLHCKIACYLGSFFRKEASQYWTYVNAFL